MRQRDEQMQEQLRQMHSLLMSREGQQSPSDADNGDDRAVKRRRTGR
jgi:hypothetical protein